MTVEFGDRLKALMAERGLTQSLLSKKSGIERTVINRMISGKAKPRFEQIYWLAKTLGVEIQELLAADLPDEIRLLLEQLRDAITRIALLEGELEAARRSARTSEANVEDVRARAEQLRVDIVRRSGAA